MKTLRRIGTVKDGGSRIFVDELNNKYWQNFALGNNPDYGKIFEGDINKKNPKLAIGSFNINGKIIKQ